MSCRRPATPASVTGWRTVWRAGETPRRAWEFAIYTRGGPRERGVTRCPGWARRPDGVLATCPARVGAGDPGGRRAQPLRCGLWEPGATENTVTRHRQGEKNMGGEQATAALGQGRQMAARPASGLRHWPGLLAGTPPPRSTSHLRARGERRRGGLRADEGAPLRSPPSRVARHGAGPAPWGPWHPRPRPQPRPSSWYCIVAPPGLKQDRQGFYPKRSRRDGAIPASHFEGCGIPSGTISRAPSRPRWRHDAPSRPHTHGTTRRSRL